MRIGRTRWPEVTLKSLLSEANFQAKLRLFVIFHGKIPQNMSLDYGYKNGTSSHLVFLIHTGTGKLLISESQVQILNLPRCKWWKCIKLKSTKVIKLNLNPIKFDVSWIDALLLLNIKLRVTFNTFHRPYIYIYFETQPSTIPLVDGLC